mgnify:CR=1 FL=1
MYYSRRSSDPGMVGLAKDAQKASIRQVQPLGWAYIVVIITVEVNGLPVMIWIIVLHYVMDAIGF